MGIGGIGGGNQGDIRNDPNHGVKLTPPDGLRDGTPIIAELAASQLEMGRIETEMNSTMDQLQEAMKAGNAPQAILVYTNLALLNKEYEAANARYQAAAKAVSDQFRA